MRSLAASAKLLAAVAVDYSRLLDLLLALDLLYLLDLLALSQVLAEDDLLCLFLCCAQFRCSAGALSSQGLALLLCARALVQLNQISLDLCNLL